MPTFSKLLKNTVIIIVQSVSVIRTSGKMHILQRALDR